MRRVVVGLAIAFATLTPSWALANDQQIAQHIIQKLEQHKRAGQLKGFGIDLQVEDGTVFMNGRVTTPEQQKTALETAQLTPGVKKVVNGLKVTSPAPEATAATAEPKSSRRTSTWGESIKNAFGGDSSQGEAQQVANVEPIQSSIMKAASSPSPKLATRPTPVPSYTAETGSGVQTVSTTARPSQSQLVASQAAPGQVIPAPPVAQPQALAPRTLQSQYQAANPVARATMPGHSGPARPQTPVAFAPARPVSYNGQPMMAAPMAYGQNAPIPTQMAGGVGIAPARYDHPQMPGYAWPSYASHPNYAAVTYPKQYSPTAWPYIGPFYPYPQVPLGWRKVTLEWDDGWWMLDFHDQNRAWKPHR